MVVDLFPKVESSWVAKVDLLTASSAFSKDCQIEAKNDLEAVSKWLEEYKAKKNTYSSYRREAMRFLMWCVYEQGVTLAKLKKEDMEAYFNFLQQPPQNWCIKQDQELEQDPNIYGWRPFKGKLGRTALLMAIRVLNSMLNYLVQAEYIRANPIKLIKQYSKLTINFNEYKYKVWERMLEIDEWEAVQQALLEMPTDTNQQKEEKCRTQFLFALLYLLGLRINEVVTHTWASFRKKDGKWWFFAKGKGDKLGHIPVNEQLLSFIKVYRSYMQLSQLPLPDENEGLIRSTKTNQPLKITQLYKSVKAIGKQAANFFPEDPLKQQKLRALSPHWLRHLAASHQDKLGIPAAMIQNNLRHKSRQTTQLYVHAEDNLRYAEMQKMQLQCEPASLAQEMTCLGYEFRLKLTRGPISKVLGITRMIQTIEQQIFQGLTHIRIGEPIDELVAKIKQQGVSCSAVELVYQVREQEVVESPKIWEDALKRQAAVWLFDCEINSIGLTT